MVSLGRLTGRTSNAVMLPQSVWKRVLQRGFSGCLEASSSLRFGRPAALLRGPGAAGRRRASGLPGVREQTLIVIKPDGVQRRLVGQIIQRFEQRGFKLVGLKMLQVSEELLSQHYGQLTTKPFYPSLLHYMTSAPVVVMVWEGHKVIQTSRSMVGHTNPAEAQVGTVRGDFSIHVSRNVVHASDSLEGAQKEIQLWFQRNELLKWDCWDQDITCEA